MHCIFKFICYYNLIKGVLYTFCCLFVYTSLNTVKCQVLQYKRFGPQKTNNYRDKQHKLHMDFKAYLGYCTLLLVFVSKRKATWKGEVVWILSTSTFFSLSVLGKNKLEAWKYISWEIILSWPLVFLCILWAESLAVVFLYHLFNDF